MSALTIPEPISIVAMGAHLHFSDKDMRRVTAAALIHDIGKISIPNALLDKPGALDQDEFRLIKQHTSIGYDIIKKVEGFDAEMADMVLSHHEYLDGTGYPNGLMNGQIGDLVRVITIADVYAALIEKRAYKPAMSGRQAFDILLGMRGKLDMPIVKAQAAILAA
jgi:HD-GYP domain-containing protein (c-di-GMP phosphodiesterase class II)